MRFIIWVLLAVIAILVVMCYALLVAAGEADLRAEEMRRAYEERKDERSRR